MISETHLKRKQHKYKFEWEFPSMRYSTCHTWLDELLFPSTFGIPVIIIGWPGNSKPPYNCKKNVHCNLLKKPLQGKPQVAKGSFSLGPCIPQWSPTGGVWIFGLKFFVGFFLVLSDLYMCKVWEKVIKGFPLIHKVGKNVHDLGSYGHFPPIFEYGTKLIRHSSTPAWCLFSNLFRQF